MVRLNEEARFMAGSAKGRKPVIVILYESAYAVTIFGAIFVEKSEV